MDFDQKPCEERIAKCCMKEVEIWIDAPPDVVWQKAVHEVNHWWKTNLHEKTQGVFIEAEVNGRYWERFDDTGNGVLLGIVTYLDAPHTIHFSASSGMAGIALGTNTWRFMDVDGGTLMQFCFQIMTDFPERCLSPKFNDKTMQLLKSLKAYVEGA